jgi:PAS domain S-box-containing protein
VVLAGACASLPGLGAAAGGAVVQAEVPVVESWLFAGGIGIGMATVVLVGWAFRLARDRRDRRADRHWRSLLAMVDSMIWEAEVRQVGADLQWTFTLLQPSGLYRRLLGTEVPTREMGLWRRLVLPQQAEMDALGRDAILAGERGYEQEFPLGADGATFWLHETVAVEPVSPGRWHLVGVVNDETARHEADQARRMSEQRVERLAAQTHAMFWQARVTRRGDGTYHWELFLPHSELYRTLFGNDPGERHPCLSWGRIGVPETAEMHERACHAIEHQLPGYEQEFHVPRPEGDLWLREQVTIRPQPSGDWELFGVVVDTTEQRRTQEVRRAIDAQLKQILVAANCLLWQGEVRLEPSGRLEWNTFSTPSVLFKRIFGELPADGICRLHWHRIVVPENREIDERADAAVLRGDSGYEQEFRVLNRNHVLWLHEQTTITPAGPGRWTLAGVIVDITARHEAEDTRRAHQAQLARLTETVDCLLWQARVFDLGDGFLHWVMFIPPSRLYREIFGEEPGEAPMFRWERVLDAATDMQIDGAATRAIKGGERGYSQEFRALRLARACWLHEQVAIEPIGDGQWELVGVITDVTHRHEAEQAVRDHQEQLDKIFDVVDCLLWRAQVVERHGLLEWLVFMPSSSLYHRLFGPADPDPCTSLNWGDAGCPEYPDMEQRSAAALRSGSPGYEQEFRAYAGGRMYWLFERTSIVRVAFDRWELVGVVVDVTARKCAEAELAAEKERLAVTLRAMAEGVITTGTDGRVQFVNPAAALFIEWAAEAVVGRAVDEVCPLRHADTGAVVAVPLAQVLAGDGVAELPARTVVIGRNGGKRLVEGCFAPIHAADSTVVGTVLVLRDNTERDRLEQELQRASKLESVGLLAGGIAHDFNNILTAVLGNLTLALFDVEPKGEVGRALREAERAALRARDLTHQLLTFAKGGDPVRSAVHLPEMLEEVTRFALHGSRVKAEFDLAPELWPADADKVQISRVVQNLVINAVQAMPAGGQVRILARNERLHGLDRPPLPSGRYVYLAVSDTGVGIKGEHLERIFEPYFTTKQSGSGLGLATVYSIVRKHKGLIQVESELGRGTTFHVRLPAVEGGQHLSAAPGALEGRAALHGRILFMDDEEPICRMATTMLQRLGCEVESACDGQQAVDLYRAALEAERPFAVVVMDLTVPGGMGGLEALAGLHALDPAVRAIVSSGYSNDPVLANYRDYGFSGRVAKPYELADFGRVLREVLEAK